LELLQDPRNSIAGWINQFGPIWVYAPLMLIIFLETGLVVTPFLPGDSLLFAAGVFANAGGGLNILALIGLATLAAIAGDACNYWIGRKLGKAIIASGRVKALSTQNLEKAQNLLNKYGLFAVFLARFFPFIRTIAPFLAGFGNMHFPRFSLFNIAGAICWVTLFSLLGYFFGGLPLVRDHFEWVILGIVLISVVPAVVGLIKARLALRQAKKED